MNENPDVQVNEKNGANGHSAPAGHYASVNGLKLYYEIHNPAQPSDQPPLVLLHGALSAIGTSFGQLLPGLTRNRQVIGIEQQAHGHTGDIDRTLTADAMTEDVVELLRQLGIKKADIFGYSMGAGVGLALGIRYPQLVRKLVLASVTYDTDGFHPGLMDGILELKPEYLYGTPFHDEYISVAPDPDNFPALIKRVTEMNSNIPSWPAEAVRSIQAPTLLIIGDSDIVRPEHAVEMFRLLGGGVSGDNFGLPRSRLAILPGTSHVNVVYKADWLISMINEFLDEPISQ